MLKKGFKEMMAEANAVIDVVSVHDAVARHGDPEVVFVDVREGGEAQRGRIPGSVHVPRGFLEFMADPESPMHQPALSSGKQLILLCASGGRSTLACKTLADMGIENAYNMSGGFQAWVQAGGPVET